MIQTELSRMICSCSGHGNANGVLALVGAVLTVERANIPGDVVAPPNSLNPVNSASIDPHQVSRALDEAVHRYVSVVQVLQHWPPGPCQVVHPVPEDRQKSSLNLCTFALLEP